MTYRFWITAVVFLGLAVPASAQSPYTWNTTDGNWNTAGNWLDNLNNPAVPVSSTTTGLIFNASGTTSYTATNDIAGTFILNSLTVNNSGSGTITLAGTRLDFGGTAPTLDVTGSLVIANIMGGTAQITKNGTGTVTQLSNSNVFTGTLTINAGTWITGALATGTFNFNPTSIVVNNGGTYQFGNATIGDPNLPNATYITVNTGGTVNWQEGEVLGGFHLQGGTINFQQGGTTSNEQPRSPGRAVRSPERHSHSPAPRRSTRLQPVSSPSMAAHHRCGQHQHRGWDDHPRECGEPGIFECDAW